MYQSSGFSELIVFQFSKLGSGRSVVAEPPYEAMPVELTGSYKYAPSNLDAGAGLLLEFYQGGSVLYSDYQAFTTNATYTSFTLPITLSGTPDSVLMYAFAGENPGSVLHLDDLSFNGGDVGLEEQFSTQTMVYPNPAQENIHLRTDANRLQ